MGVDAGGDVPRYPYELQLPFLVVDPVNSGPGRESGLGSRVDGHRVRVGELSDCGCCDPETRYPLLRGGGEEAAAEADGFGKRRE